MSIPAHPRPDRWLVVPETAFGALVGPATPGGLLALRLDFGDVEPVAPAALVVRARELLSDGWGHVRVLLADGEGPWREAVEAALLELASALGAQDQERVRLHDQARDPAGVAATLRAPDEAVLAHWLRQRRPTLPEVSTPESRPGWAERYAEAFTAWREGVEREGGPEVFDLLFGAPDAASPVAAVGSHVLAANDRVFLRAAGAPPLRGAVSMPDEAVYLGRWADRVLGVDITIEAYGSRRPGVDVVLVVHAPAPDAGDAVPLRALDVLGRDGELLASAPLHPEAGHSSARASLANAEDRVLRSIRRGESAVRLHWGPDQATP